MIPRDLEAIRLRYKSLILLLFMNYYFYATSKVLLIFHTWYEPSNMLGMREMFISQFFNYFAVKNIPF